MSHPHPAPLKSAVSIPQAFAEQVRRHAGRPAVSDGGRVLSYRELHDLSCRAAVTLQELASPHSESVAILAAHGADLIIALLAVLEAGKVAVVLDPDDPPARLRELVEAAEAGLVVTDAPHAAIAVDAVPPGCRVIGLEGALEAAVAGAPRAGPGPGPEDPALIMFTSGSTGKPKGVLATHKNVVLNIWNYTAAAGLAAGDRMTLLSRCHFMASMSATFGALLNGACLVPFDIRRRGFSELRQWLLAERITVYHSVPTLFRRFCESLSSGDIFPAMRLVKLGGEPMMNHDVRLWRRHFPASSVLVNGLGLSEANGNLCHFEIRPDTAADFRVVPVGCPLPGVEIVLLGDDGRLVAGGATGEIGFRCPHRSPGYWRSDEFTARLVPSPYGDGGEPFFMTGDLGRWRPDGCLEHLGRKDGMFKLRGIRIEPAQVEAALFEDPRIRECAVGLRGQGGAPKQLVAWFVAAAGQDPPAAELRARLGRRLPPALIPSAFIALPALPTTPGGKIDRKALPSPSAFAGPARSERPRPNDAIELALTQIWEKLLKVRSAGIDDNFFERGGDSLLAAVLLSKIDREFRANISLGEFMTSPTVAGVARLVRRETADPAHRRLVCTQSGGEGTPFFFVPGAGVVVTDAIASSRPAAAPRAHYWLQYRGIDGVEAPHRSIPAIADYFLEEVRRIQAVGPYLLGGGSFGALVALEAAHRLRDAGDTVGVLVVEDCLLDGCLTFRPGRSWRERLERALLGLMPVGRRFEVTGAGIRDGLRQWRYRILVPVARWRSRLDGRPLPKVYRFHDLLNSALAAKRRYVPQPYSGRMVLIRTRFDAAARLFELEPTLGWSRICPSLDRRDLGGEKGERDTDPFKQTEFLECLEAILCAADDPLADERAN